MNTIYFDCYAGISGDMTVAALLDLGVPIEHLRKELATLPLPVDSYAVSTERAERRHVTALKFDVQVNDQRTARHYADIDAMIGESGLAEPVKERSRRIFRCLAEAEATVHGVPMEKVHFHEVGAVDSIVDIIGTAICLDYLAVEAVHCAALPLGSGFIQTAHGRLPVPAPATALLLKGLEVHGECGAGERVTPTGAAILAALAGPKNSGNRPAMKIVAVGHGAGTRDFEDAPNILRAFLGTTAPVGGDKVAVVETNLDDCTPETLGYVMERLFEEGALDVFFTPIQMKKNRPATKLSFLCRPELLERLAILALTETSAIGVRHYVADRLTLERRNEERLTPFGNMNCKLIFHDNQLLRITPEYEECRRVAGELGIPLREVLETLAKLGQSGRVTSKTA